MREIVNEQYFRVVDRLGRTYYFSNDGLKVTEFQATGKKTCPKCKQIKEIDEFYNCVGRPDRHSDLCKLCGNAKPILSGRKRQQQKRFRTKYPDKIRAASSLYRERHPGRKAAQVAFRRATKRQATPAWVNRKILQKFYEEARQLTVSTGVKYQVDHEVPLKHSLVCGLHVPANLKVVTEEYNLNKYNHFEPAFIQTLT